VRDAATELYVAAADGSGLLKLSDAQTGLGVGLWGFSPDGTRIFYAQYPSPGKARRYSRFVRTARSAFA
jgi:hypothetical protein